MAIEHVYFGGSFYPPHKAHTEMLGLALKASATAAIHLVPTKQNPLKSGRGAELSLIQAWLEDLKATFSTKDFSRCELETLEILSPHEKNFTADSIEELKKPRQSWALLLGSDSALTLEKWKSPQKLLKSFEEIWIVPRGKDFSEEKISAVLKKLHSETKFKFLNAVTQTSSTEIRNGTPGQPLEELLSPRVLEIWKHLEH